jgi:hypothetical protein
MRVCVPGGSLLLLGGCGLSDQQLVSILQTVITTGLSTFVQQLIGVLVSAGTATP